MNRTYELDQFFGAYLHEDFEAVYGTWENAVREYASDAKPERVRCVREALQELLDAPDSYGATEAMFREIRHSGYHPWADYSEAEAWLARVIELLDTGLQEQGEEA